MQSIKHIFKIGYGPSSSHTMGPNKAALYMLSLFPNANRFKVILYGSLALTGKGHLTDYILKKTFSKKKCEVIWDKFTPCNYHPNTLDIYAYLDDIELGFKRFYSIGGGSIEIEGEKTVIEENIYPFSSFSETKKYLIANNLSLHDYVKKIEGDDIVDYLHECYLTMKKAIKEGLSKEGTLPGSLKVKRKAKDIYEKIVDSDLQTTIFSYAYAVSEENASGGKVVTAPTCGSCGVLPAVLVALEEKNGYQEKKILEAMMVAGYFGNLIKNNASISGAEAGCQAEIGAACSMAAAAVSYLFNYEIDKIEQSAEIALEHHLGLTCDPIGGYVQIPCIERNAICANRALDSAKLVNLFDSSTNKISFDLVCQTMLETGKDLHVNYRETSRGGLAIKYRK